MKPDLRNEQKQPKYYVKTLKIFFFLFFLVFLQVQSGTANIYANAKSEYQSTSQAYKTLQTNEAKQKFLHNWNRIIDRYNKIVKKYPKSTEAAKSLYNVGKIYQTIYRWNRSSDFIRQSNQAYQKLASDYPKNYLADDAIFQTAQNYELLLKDFPAARIQYQVLIKNYPKSSFLPEAQKKLAKLGNSKPKPPKTSAASSKSRKTAAAATTNKKAKTEYNAAAKRYHDLIDNEKKQKFLHNWNRVISRFEKIVKKYPNSAEAPKSLFNIGLLYQSIYRWNKTNDYIRKSIQAYRKLAADYPQNYLVDDALFQIAENYEIRLKDKNIALLEYENLLRRFPKSSFAKKARQRIQRLGGIEQDLKIAGTETSEEKQENETAFGGLTELEAENAPRVKITGVKHYSTSEWTRIVINSTREARYKYQTLGEDKKNGKSRRIYVDILNSKLSPSTKKNIAANDGIIKNLRISQFDKNTTRVVVDLISFKKINVFNHALPRQNKIILDISGQRSTKKWGYAIREKSDENEQKDSTSDKPQVNPIQNIQVPKVSLSEVLGLKVNTIVLDAGHGGKDPGAIGFRFKEKHIALKIVLKIKAMLNKKHPNLTVLLTRDKDQFIPLEKRTAFANENQGDLFISVHVNAAQSPRLYGIETYFLNLTNDKDSLRLAAKENRSSLKNISDLQSIINDLLTGTKLRESEQLATMVQKKVYVNANRYGKTRYLGVKQAPFVVLIGAEMPSVLVEVGFITNRLENRRLREDKYLNTLASGILKGIEDYMNQVNKGLAKAGS